MLIEVLPHWLTCPTANSRIADYGCKCKTPQTPPDEVERPSWAHQRADAMAVIFESFLAHGSEVMSGGERHQVVGTFLQKRCKKEEGITARSKTAQPLPWKRRVAWLACQCHRDR